MNKKVLSAVLFVMLVAGMLYFIQYGLDAAYKKRASDKFSKLMRREIDSPVMIFGSSVAYHQFHPAIINSVTGSGCYNMGWPGMFFTQYNCLVGQYLSYQRNCKCIVIACDFDNLGKKDLITNPNLFYAYLGNRYVYKSLHNIEPQKIALARYVPGYKLTLLDKSFYTTLLIPGKKLDTLSGFEPLNNKWEPTQLGLHDTRYNEDLFNQFSEFVKAIAAKSIKTVIVIPPVYADGYRLITNAAMIQSKYASLAGKNIYFLDYTSDSICNNRSYFHNYTHLDSLGASVFSHIFAQDLSKILHE